MLFSAAVDTTIGLFLVYLTLSLVCTSVNEAIAGLFRLRARNLFNEVSRVLADDKLRDAFWRNGLVRSLSRSSGFGLSKSTPTNLPKVTPGTAPSYIENQVFALALIASLRKIGSENSVTGAGGNSPLEDALATLGIDANAAIDQTTKSIEDWFDQLMNRASGVYKRWISLLTFAVALTITVAINADTFQIARTLWQDDAIRKAVVESATRLADLNAQSGPELPELLQINDMLPLPLGWSMQQPIDVRLETVLSKVMGLLLTTLALSLGAPFWFDLLSRFVSVRNSGRQAADDSLGGGWQANRRIVRSDA
jgi:hypothetical protein